MEAIKSLLLREVGELLQERPALDLGEAKVEAEKRLVEAGLSYQAVRRAADELALREAFTRTLIPNPNFLLGAAHQLAGFIIDARASGRSILSNHTSWSKQLAVFHIYGAQDVILWSFDSEETNRKIEGELELLQVRSLDHVSIERVPYYYRLPAPEIPRLLDLDDKLRELIRLGLPNDMNNGVFEQLKASGVVLGTRWIENTNVTQRIRAFVGVKGTGMGHRAFQRTFVEQLLQDGLLRRRVTSVFQCKGGTHDFVVDLTVSTAEELDQATDKLTDVFQSPTLGIETSTFVIARVHADPVPRLGMEGQAQREATPANPEYDRAIEEMRHDLPPDEASRLARLPANEKTFLVWAHLELGRTVLPTMDDQTRAEVRQAIRGFERAALNAAPTGFVSPLSDLNSALERNARDVIKRLAVLFYDGDIEKLRADVPFIPDNELAKIRKRHLGARPTLGPTHQGESQFDYLTLGHCKQFFSTWNARSGVAPQLAFPVELPSRLQALSSVRNPIIHGNRTPRSWLTRVDVARKEVLWAMFSATDALLTLHDYQKLLSVDLPSDDLLREIRLLRKQVEAFRVEVRSEFVATRQSLEGELRSIRKSIYELPERTAARTMERVADLESLLTRVSVEAKDAKLAEEASSWRSKTGAITKGREALALGADIAGVTPPILGAVSFLSKVPLIDSGISHEAVQAVVQFLRALTA